MNFSEQFERLYARGSHEVDRRILPILIDLTKTPGQKRVLLDRQFSHGAKKSRITATYNGIFEALDVSLSVDGYGRKVRVFVDEKDSQRAIQYVRGLAKKLKSYSG